MSNVELLDVVYCSIIIMVVNVVCHNDNQIVIGPMIFINIYRRFFQKVNIKMLK